MGRVSIFIISLHVLRGKSFEFITIINHLRISLETDSLNKKYYIYSTVNKVEKEIKTYKHKKITIAVFIHLTAHNHVNIRVIG